MPMPVKFAAEVAEDPATRRGRGDLRVPLPDAASAVEAGPVPAPRPGRLRSVAALAGVALLYDGQRLAGEGVGAIDDRRQGDVYAEDTYELQPGCKVWMKAPYGDFIVRTSPEHDVVFIAGGTGITPFVAFMEDSMVQGLEGRVWLHYGREARICLSFATLPSVAQGSSPRFALPATPRAAQRARRSPAASTWQGPWRARRWQGGDVLFVWAARDDPGLSRPIDRPVQRSRVEREDRRLGVGTDIEVTVGRIANPSRKTRRIANPSRKTRRIGNPSYDQKD